MRLGVAAAVVDDTIVSGDVEVSQGLIAGVGIGGPGVGLAVPGFVDVHVHGFAGVDFGDADVDGFRSVAAAMTATGVTAFHPTLMSVPEAALAAALARLAVAGEVSSGARVMGMHLEGPFLSPNRAGAQDPQNLLAPDPGVVDRLLASGPIAHMTLAPELPGGLAIVRHLVERGIVVSVGHSEASAEVSHSAFDAGATALTHVFNALRPLAHRDPGVVGAALSRSDVFITAIFDGIHLSAEAAVIAMRAAGGMLVAITDATAAANGMLGSREAIVTGGAVRLADGTLAGSVLTMDQAFRNLIDLGAGVGAAARATSSAPAALAGHPELGVLDPGTPADVVVLDDEYLVRRTLVGGVEMFAG